MKKCKRVISLVLCAALGITQLGVPVKAQVKKGLLMTLQANKSYHVDLNKDGKKEAVKYSVNYDSNKMVTAVKLYVNNKVAYNLKSNGSAFSAKYYVYDMNTSDKQLELYYVLTGASDCVSTAGFQQYQKSKIVDLKIQRGTNKNFKLSKFVRISLPKQVDGKGHFALTCDTAYGYGALGCYYVNQYFSLKSGKIVGTVSHTANFVGSSASYEYKAKTVIPVYKTASKSKPATFSIAKDTKVKILKIYSSSLNYTFGNTLTGYAYVTTAKGKGWIYIPKATTTSPLFTNVPAWG